MNNYDEHNDDYWNEYFSEEDFDDSENIDRMEGDFSFVNLPSGLFACFIAIFVPAILYVAVEDKAIGMSLAALVFIIFLTLTIFFCYIPGNYIADDKGVTFRILFREYSFQYSNIQSVSVSKSKGEKHDRFTGNFSIKTELVICTKYGAHSFIADSPCDFSPDEPINDAVGFNKRVSELEFFRLAKFIEEHINKQTNK